MAEESKKGESFADLFEQEKAKVPGRRARALSVGDEVEGVVSHVGPEAVFVDLDAKQQAFFDRVELAGPGGDLHVKAGDPIKGHVIEIDRAGQVRLGRTFARGDAGGGTEHLRIAHERGIAVEGRVSGINKGGAEVDVGGARGFCPMSQLDVRFVQNPAELIGRTERFLITELRDRDVVLSRRALLEREAREQRGRIVSALEEGSTVRGRVSQIREFGAFVDLGGVEGLIPVRELSHDRVRVEDVVSIGDVVEVQIRKVEQDGDKLKITLSLKALATDPWDGIDAIAPVGRVVAGQVSKLMEFGAFVRLAAGVEGLLHVSELGASVRHPSEVLEVGAQVLCAVKSVDRERKRIALVPAQEGASLGDVSLGPSVVLGSVVDAVVEKVERFGVFVQLAGTKGRAGRGLIPNAELGTDRGVDVRKEFPAGRQVRAKVIETGEGRLRLSIKAAIEDADRAAYDGYRQEQAAPRSMGTLGDLLKGKRGR